MPQSLDEFTLQLHTYILDVISYETSPVKHCYNTQVPVTFWSGMTVGKKRKFYKKSDFVRCTITQTVQMQHTIMSTVMCNCYNIDSFNR